MRSWLWLPLALAGGAAAADEAEYQTVVTATTPVHGSGLPQEMAPSNVQTASTSQVQALMTASPTDVLEQAMGSVHLNQVLGNPLQADVQYRGFGASPVLGAPQGMAVFLDGVRLNEPFGDVVNWDLVPKGALRSMNLTAGSSPVFGLNTLGGALSMETQDGFAFAPGRVELQGGSFGRRAMSFDLGKSEGRWGVFVTGDALAEDGWRDFSPSDVKRAYAVASYRGARTALDLSLLAGDARLDGNGPSPAQLLAIDRRAIFTRPDRTTDRMVLTTLRGQQRLGEDLQIAGVAYLRGSHVQTVNGDQAEDTSAGFDAALNQTDTRQHGYGASAQLAWTAHPRGRDNHLFLGAAADVARAHFGAQSTYARLSSTREALSADEADPDSPVELDTVTRTYGVFASDTLTPLPGLHVTAAARFNHERLTLDDRISDALDGRHHFARLNPALGLSYVAWPAFDVFGGYSESARAPTPLELSCASAADPCRLPNGFVADPPLRQVVARTIEAGARGRVTLPGHLRVRYAAAVFHAETDDDILFIASGAVANRGYFDNIGRTRRRGVELGLEGRWSGEGWLSVQASAHYTFLDATFRSPFVARSPHHPDAVDGALPVPVGSRLPTVPRQMGNASVTLQLRRLSLGFDMVANGSQYLRGDEANRLPAVDGWVVFDVRASFAITDWLAVFARARNLFDARYASYGVLGDARPVLGDQFDQPRFEGPGAPRGGWIGVELW